jgi:hypothetical protein
MHFQLVQCSDFTELVWFEFEALVRGMVSFETMFAVDDFGFKFENDITGIINRSHSVQMF